MRCFAFAKIATWHHRGYTTHKTEQSVLSSVVSSFIRSGADIEIRAETIEERESHEQLKKEKWAREVKLKEERREKGESRAPGGNMRDARIRARARTHLMPSGKKIFSAQTAAAERGMAYRGRNETEGKPPRGDTPPAARRTHGPAKVKATSGAERASAARAGGESSAGMQVAGGLSVVEQAERLLDADGGGKGGQQPQEDNGGKKKRTRISKKELEKMTEEEIAAHHRKKATARQQNRRAPKNKNEQSHRPKAAAAPQESPRAAAAFVPAPAAAPPVASAPPGVVPHRVAGAVAVSAVLPSEPAGAAPFTPPRTLKRRLSDSGANIENPYEEGQLEWGFDDLTPESALRGDDGVVTPESFYKKMAAKKRRRE